MTLTEAVRIVLDHGNSTRIGSGYTIDLHDPEKDIWLFSSRMRGYDEYIYINNDPVFKSIEGEVRLCKNGDWQNKVIKEAEKIERQHAKRN